MEDRVSQHPGRVRLIPVEGEEHVYDMEPADAPVKEGTKLNKANLLTDATAAKIGLTNSATPNMAISRLQDNIINERAKIGTVLATTRTDLGDKWILCNGSQITSSQYPELFNMLDSTVQGKFIQTEISLGLQLRIVTIKYLNGRFVILAHSEAGQRDVYLIHSSDGVSWTANKVYSNYDPCDITYAGGRYVITGRYQVNNFTRISILYGRSPNTTFTENLVTTGGYGDSICTNGTYIMIAVTKHSGSGPTGASVFFLTASSLSYSKSIDLDNTSSIGWAHKCWYAGSYWIVQSGTTLYYSSTSLPSGFSQTTLATSNVTDVAYGGSTKRFLIAHGNQSLSVSSSASPSSFSRKTDLRVNPISIVFSGNTAYILGSPPTNGYSAALSSYPFTNFTYFNTPVSTVSSTYTSAGLAATNGDVIISIHTPFGNKITINRAYGRVLPAISADRSYVYIKARGET